MYEVFFINSSNIRKSIGTAKDDAEAKKIMFKFLKERNYRVYYTRYIEKLNGEIIVDVGSHTEFFNFTPINTVENKQ